jgi:Abnormal spindle-like microcephaly-assoc'd, ASPM-SPD-2-Hydin
MRLPQSILLSTRVFTIIKIALIASMLPLCARASAQQLTCTPCGVHFGSVPIGQTETEILVLANSGSTSVTVSAMSLGGSEFSLANLSLPFVLAAGQSVPVNVTFSPSATGWTGQQGTFTSNASNPRLRFQAAGSGIRSNSVAASPASVWFGQVTVGTSSALPVVLTNARAGSVTVTALQMTGTGFSVSGPTLPVTLATGQSMTMNVTYAPLSAGMSLGSVFISGANLGVPLTGTGTTSLAGQLTISPAAVNFGDVTVGSTGIQPITMSAATASVTVSSDASSNSQFVLDGASFPFTIPAGQSVSFNVAFTPSNSGTVSGSLSFTSNASNSQTNESLTGIGTAPVYNVDLYWNASSDVVGYNVYRSTSASGGFAKINSAVDPNTAYTDSSVTSGTTYYYEASSVNSAGQESVPSTPPVVASVP